MTGSIEQAEPPQLGRRILRLFRPYRGQLALITISILVTSALSVISALLVRQVFDKALFVAGGPDLHALYPLVAALIAIPIINGVLNIVQVYLTEIVGNRVLRDLRDRLFGHLEKLSLAFYTATRSGEVQSRLDNDVGGVQTTITSTASSVVSNVVTLVSSVVAMLLLSPLLTAISLAVTPMFVLFSRRVGRARRGARRDAQASLASMQSITQETLSVSGILLAKVFGRQEREVDRYRDRERRPGRAAGSPGDGRPLVLCDHPGVLRDQPRARISGGRSAGHPRGPVSRDAGGVHDPAEPAADPDQPAAPGLG